MKIDLDELERVARDAESLPSKWFTYEQLRTKLECWPQDGQHIAANSPAVTLALIARIRELETALDGELRLASIPERDQDDNWADQNDLNQAVLARGTVIP